jgi:hypothetical protein
MKLTKKAAVRSRVGRLSIEDRMLRDDEARKKVLMLDAHMRRAGHK